MTLFVEPAGNTTHDVNMALTYARSQGIARVCCPAVDFTVNEQVQMPENMHLEGVPGQTRFLLPSMLQGHVINAFAGARIGVSGIVFDLGGFKPEDRAWPDLGSGAIVLGGASGIAMGGCFVRDVEIHGFGYYGICLYGGLTGLQCERIKIVNTELTDAVNPVRIGIMGRIFNGTNEDCRFSDITTDGVCGLDAALYKSTIANFTALRSPFGAGVDLELDDAHGWSTGNQLVNIRCNDAPVGGGLECWATNTSVNNLECCNNVSFGASFNRPGCALTNALLSGNGSASTVRYGLELFFDNPGAQYDFACAGVRYGAGNAHGNNFINRNPAATIFKAAMPA